MARHYLIVQDQREAALSVATAALRAARGLATARPGNLFVPNVGEDGLRDGTGTWIGGGEVGNGGVAQWVGDTTPPGRPTGVSAASSGGMVVATWDGTLEGGVPADFDHVTITALCGGERRELGELRGAGSVTSGGYSDGDSVELWAVAYDAARDASGALAPNASAEGDHVTVTVTDLAEQALEAAEATGQHFWADDSGVHVSTDEADPEGDSNVLVNALGILLRAAQRNLVSVTPSGFAVYGEDGEAVATLSESSSQVGPSSGGNTLVTPSGFSVRDGAEELASFGPSLVSLGKNSVGSVVEMCGGAGSVSCAAGSSDATLSIGFDIEGTGHETPLTSNLRLSSTCGGTVAGMSLLAGRVSGYGNATALGLGVDYVGISGSGGTGYYPTSSIGDALWAWTPRSVLQSQTWSDITVRATYRCGAVFVTVERWDRSGTALVPNGSPSVVGQLLSGYAPSATVRQYLGTQGGVWLLMEVTTGGAVQLRTVYASDWTSWGAFSGSLSYARPA